MSLQFILKIKFPLIILQVVLFILLGWSRFTFSNYQELIVFLPLLILYFNEKKYDELYESGLNISYYTYELIIFMFLVFSNVAFTFKIYFEYF